MAFACLLVDLWLTPFELIFIGERVAPPSFELINTAITLFWCCDICLNFTTGFIERDMLVLQRWPSVKKYLSSWFAYDRILGKMQPNFMSFTRLSKATKVLKTIRFLKVIRAMRLIQNMDRASYALEDLPMLATFAKLLQCVSAVIAVSHIHGCLWIALQPGRRGLDNIDEALLNYSDSLNWAINMLALGETEKHQLSVSSMVCFFEMAVAVERLIALTVIGSWALTWAMINSQEKAHFDVLKSSAMKFFRKHNVTSETQIQVLYCLFETRAAQIMQRHFKQLMSENLPEELRRTVSEELWVQHLLSLEDHPLQGGHRLSRRVLHPPRPPRRC